MSLVLGLNILDNHWLYIFLSDSESFWISIHSLRVFSEIIFYSHFLTETMNLIRLILFCLFRSIIFQVQIINQETSRPWSTIRYIVRLGWEHSIYQSTDVSPTPVQNMVFSPTPLLLKLFTLHHNPLQKKKINHYQKA